MPTIRDFSDPNFRGAAPEQIEQVIMAGRNLMPGFGTALSRPKIQHLGGYARRLGDASAKAQGMPPVKAPLPVAPQGPGM
jgi:mono/diheme cytochrome c family protein